MCFSGKSSMILVARMKGLILNSLHCYIDSQPTIGIVRGGMTAYLSGKAVVG